MTTAALNAVPFLPQAAGTARTVSALQSLMQMWEEVPV